MLSGAVTEDCAVDAVDFDVGLATTFCGSVGDLSPRAQHAARITQRDSNTSRQYLNSVSLVPFVCVYACVLQSILVAASFRITN